MIDTNSLAMQMRYMVFWNMPYDTGNLAYNSIGDLKSYSANEVGFDMLFINGCEYGRALQENKIIHYKIRGINGQFYEGSYINEHYNFLGKAADYIADALPLYAPIRRVS